MQNQLESLKVGSTFNRINVAEIKSFLVSCPPRNEQDAIAEYCDDVYNNTNELREKIIRSIAKLREYRTALISAAVTGKIDVRDNIA